MRGIIVYGRDGYEDGGEFVEQVGAYVASHDDVELVLSDEVSVLVNGSGIHMLLPGNTEIDEGNAPDWVIARTSDWQVICGFESLGIPCFPSSGYIRAASDKMLSHLAMANVLPCLPTVIAGKRSNVGEAVAEAGGVPCIAKATTGFGGYSVEKVHDVQEVEAIAEKLRSDGKGVMFQSLAPTPDDLRVYVAGGRVRGALMRHAKTGSSKANLSQGGTAEKFVPSEEDRHMIESALAETFPDEMGFISIDFLVDEDGRLVFNEMNCFPGITLLAARGDAAGFVEGYVDMIEKACITRAKAMGNIG